MFAGCGGLDLGMTGGFTALGVPYPRTGMTVEWAADWDEDAARTYVENPRYLGHHPVYTGDIRDYPTAAIPRCDILTAGFPCQPFSNAGDRKGVADTRGTLFEECERFAREGQPLAYVFENVKGILSSHMPDGTLVTDAIGWRMQALGYRAAEPVLLRAERYGVPQQRHRVFMVGVRSDVGPGFDPERIADFVQPEALKRLTVRHVLEDAIPHSGGEEHWKLSPQAAQMVPMITRSWKDIPYEALPLRFKKIRDQMKKYHSPNFYRRFGLDEINGTITASAQPENCGILHPTESRRYTVREIARFQSFPDDFRFVARNVQGKYRMIGNAVPPVLGYVVGSALHQYLKEYA